MELFGGVIQITGITYQLFVVFGVILAGYLLGRVSIKGVSLGTAGVFIAALFFGAIFNDTINNSTIFRGQNLTATLYQLFENLGLILFVGSVAMMAGPGFFRNLKKNYKSYMILGVLITLAGVVSSIACYHLALASIDVPKDMTQAGISGKQYFISMITGIMSGSLTSTPAFSAAQSTAVQTVPAAATGAIQNAVTIGHAIAYLFGVVGVILFVQLIPRFLKADMKKERDLISAADTGCEANAEIGKKRFTIDGYGFAAFGFVAITGILIGMIKIPLSSHGFSGTTFSLTTTGGILLCGLVISHFGHIGPINMEIDKNTLSVFREFGLALFLIGAGIPGGASFIEYFEPIYFIYGIVITIIPMFVGYFIARVLLKMPMLNALGSITGGMTSTPALGALIRTAETEDVTSSYAAVYPVALICVVLSSQFMILFFGG